MSAPSDKMADWKLEMKTSEKRAELLARVLSVEADLDPWSAPPSESLMSIPSSSALNWMALPKHVPCSIPQDEKSTCAAANLSVHVLILSICWSASYWFNQCQGFLTAVICFNLVIDEQSPFGAPKFWI